MAPHSLWNASTLLSTLMYMTLTTGMILLRSFFIHVKWLAPNVHIDVNISPWVDDSHHRLFQRLRKCLSFKLSHSCARLSPGRWFVNLHRNADKLNRRLRPHQQPRYFGWSSNSPDGKIIGLHRRIAHLLTCRCHTCIPSQIEIALDLPTSSTLIVGWPSHYIISLSYYTRLQREKIQEPSHEFPPPPPDYPLILLLLSLSPLSDPSQTITENLQSINLFTNLFIYLFLSNLVSLSTSRKRLKSRVD